MEPQDIVTEERADEIQGEMFGPRMTTLRKITNFLGMPPISENPTPEESPQPTVTNPEVPEGKFRKIFKSCAGFFKAICSFKNSKDQATKDSSPQKKQDLQSTNMRQKRRSAYTATAGSSRRAAFENRGAQRGEGSRDNIQEDVERRPFNTSFNDLFPMPPIPENATPEDSINLDVADNKEPNIIEKFVACLQANCSWKISDIKTPKIMEKCLAFAKAIYSCKICKRDEYVPEELYACGSDDFQDY